MPNKNYTRSRQKEYKALHNLEKEGWLAFRMAGSHGIADVIGIKPTECGHADHFAIRFIQIKVSENRVSTVESMEAVETPIGYVNVEFHKIAIQGDKYRAKKRAAKKKAKKSSPQRRQYLTKE